MADASPVMLWMAGADSLCTFFNATWLAFTRRSLAEEWGVGWVEGERFRFRQYFMRDYHEEPALLRGLAEDLAGCERIVTFNGGLFDIPLLETRYALNRERFPLAQALHFDLLHPARRLWKATTECTRR